MNDDTLLLVENISKRFGSRTVVDQVGFEVRRGEFMAIIGPNGAGKTTLFNLISGGVRSDSGRIMFKGRDTTHVRPDLLCRGGLSRTFQINNVFAGASVRENIRLSVISFRRKSWDMLTASKGLFSDEVERMASAVKLQDQLDKSVQELAYGDRRRLELAMALAAEPELILLDEPTCGVPLVERGPLIELIQATMQMRAMTALLIEHDMDIVFSVADRIAVMYRGRLIADDTPDAIQSNAKVQEVYLGGAAVA
ncbi:ABC transporter ATP-binding protein [Bradyrhizobium sp. Ai1a-2]|uniref:ABC transporter ATP-binding protein n=1 Tax=Bradyrhizobium sp. Ai1a-2 TaxID=196490 RepID=UPI0003F8FB93|nr:ABC transporter ATP-binding protein [Bradyrhizobium sp. Ai1a-2]